MNRKNLVKCIISNPWVIVGGLQNRHLCDWMSDRLYIKLRYRAKLGKKLNLKNPQTFNEKLQWLKLYDRRPEYTMMVDKYAVKKYVADVIGEEHIIPTLGVWDDFDDIDFTKLPDQFVLKCTHDSGGLVICKDKSKLDIGDAKAKINKCLKSNYYKLGREWPYKNVKPRIIAEKYMVDESKYELKDYKIYNFDGKPSIIQVDYGRFSNHMRNLYTTDWDFIQAEFQYPSDEDHRITKPDTLAEMLDFARKLSEKIPFLRTDFYSIDDQVFFGELTFFSESGFGKFNSDEFDQELGDAISLPGGGTN